LQNVPPQRGPRRIDKEEMMNVQTKNDAEQLSAVSFGEDGGEGRRGGRHAVVVGGSMAGLLAARVLADRFERVTVVDRDRFPEAPNHRKGVPQSRHAHGILERGQRIIGRLFPGIADELFAAGALAGGEGALAIVSPAGKLPLGEVGGEEGGGKGFFASRFLLEWHVRRRLAAYEGVGFVTDREVTGLVASEDNGRVVGVRIRRRDGDEDPELLGADLVVDASGRNSKAPRWLVELGYEAPPEETINSGIGYASRFYNKPADWPADWEGIIVNGRVPDNPRAGLILPIEDDKWHVTVGGFADNHPPTDEQGFLEWAKSLPDPSIYEAIRVAEPNTTIRGYRTPQNRLRRFERLDRWPEGFIVTGDAVCAFNPIYGQGITVSAMDAELLEESLRHKGGAEPGFAGRFQRELAKVVAAPWLVASSEDLRWGVESQGVRTTLKTRFIHRYMDLVLRRAHKDAGVARTYMGVIGMVAPPSSLFGPKVMVRVLWEALRPKGAYLGKLVPSSEEEFALSSEAIGKLRVRPAALFEG
jgi:2-polyprenyl-6-methoxyphenol hydroxylase-like FAD-dependent oxidoreductase